MFSLYLSRSKKCLLYSIVCFSRIAGFLVSIFLLPAFCLGQYDMPLNIETSPLRTVSEVIGSTTISISYGATSANNQEIWGSLYPYGDIWTPPEADVTMLSFSKDVMIEGTSIAEGTYEVYIIPNSEGDWTLVINSGAGDDDDDDDTASGYDELNDVLRLDLPPSYIDHEEKLFFDIESSDSRTCSIVFGWVNDRISFTMTTTVESFIEDQLNAALAVADPDEVWISYLIAAESLYDSGEDNAKSLIWINASESNFVFQMEWNFTEYSQMYVLGHMYWTKAKISAALGDISQAISYTQQAINMADNSYYTSNNAIEGIDLKLADWTSS